MGGPLAADWVAHFVGMGTGRVLLFVLLTTLAGVMPVRAQERIHRVLFVGNSYTYYHSMPQLFAAIAEHTMPGHRVETRFIGGGGATQQKHWEVGQALEEIRTSTWDYVILQGQSMLGLDDLRDPGIPEQFFEYAGMFNQEIRASGAETVFYMTWSRESSPQDQAYLAEAYSTIAQKTAGILAPVGLVWDRLRDSPAVHLYERDGSHPSVPGSVVAAMTLSATIFGLAPEGLPGDLYGFEILRGGKLASDRTRLSSLSDAQLHEIREAVERVEVEVGAGHGG
jgi:hypothetical protein